MVLVLVVVAVAAAGSSRRSRSMSTSRSRTERMSSTIILTRSSSRSSGSVSGKAPRVLEFLWSPFQIASMACGLTPAVHVKARAREILCEELLYEGVSEQARADTDVLAKRMWHGETVDFVLLELRDILPLDAYKKLLAFCSREYPVLYSSLPSAVTSLQLSLSGPSNSARPGIQPGSMDSASSGVRIFRLQHCTYDVSILAAAAARATGAES